MSDETDILQLIDERDASEEALSQAYFLITGRSPEWSNLFGHDEALEEIDDAQKVLRGEAHSLRERVEELERGYSSGYVDGREFGYHTCGSCAHQWEAHDGECKSHTADGSICGCKKQISEADEIVRWQDSIYQLLRKTCGDSIDGGGCDSGDPLDFTMAEIEQALAMLQDRAHELESQLSALQWVEVTHEQVCKLSQLFNREAYRNCFSLSDEHAINEWLKSQIERRLPPPPATGLKEDSDVSKSR